MNLFTDHPTPVLTPVPGEAFTLAPAFCLRAGWEPFAIFMMRLLQKDLPEGLED